MSLTTHNLHDPAVVRAADEALSNAVRLFLGGYVSEAKVITAAMQAPGPWRISRSIGLAERLDYLDSVFAPPPPCPVPPATGWTRIVRRPLVDCQLAIN